MFEPHRRYSLWPTLRFAGPTKPIQDVVVLGAIELFELRHQLLERAPQVKHDDFRGNELPKRELLFDNQAPSDAESTNEFIRFLRYSKRSASEVQSELYVALDQGYLSTEAFGNTYELARRTRAATHGFISYLKTYKCPQVKEAHPEYGSEDPAANCQPWLSDASPSTVNCEPPNQEPRT